MNNVKSINQLINQSIRVLEASEFCEGNLAWLEFHSFWYLLANRI